jgi:hypothetical protein
MHDVTSFKDGIRRMDGTRSNIDETSAFSFWVPLTACLGSQDRDKQRWGGKWTLGKQHVGVHRTSKAALIIKTDRIRNGDGRSIASTQGSQ